MKISKLIRSISCVFVLVSGVYAHAEQEIASEAPQIVQGRSECQAKIYTAYDCGPCNRLKATVQNNPAQYGCNSIEWVDCGSYRNPDPVKCPGVRSFPKTDGILCSDCNKNSPQPPRPPGNPNKPPQPPTTPGNPCTGQAKFKCPSKNPGIAYSCCLKGCDTSSSTESCLNCPNSYKLCTSSSCPAGKICVNEKDEKGCEKDFTCKDAQSPPPGSGDDEVCQIITDPVTGEQKVVCPDKGDSPPTEPDLPPAKPPTEPEDPGSGGGSTDPSDPPAPPQCHDPCPHANNPQNCCGPNEGCYQGECRRVEGCRGCTDEQVCRPTNKPPYYYGCFLKEDPSTAPGGNG